MPRNPNSLCENCPYFNSNRSLWTDEEITNLLAIPNPLAPGLSSENLALVEKAMETPHASGECRITQIGFWKQTTETNWCGEHPDFDSPNITEPEEPA